SMGAEAQALEQSLYPDLVAPLEAAGLDLQVIILGAFGSGATELCFENPLGAIPFGACAFNPPEPANTPQFKHYSVVNQSWDTWCKMLRTYDGELVDQFFQQPAGWSAWLRPQAFKQIVILSDDRVQCTAGANSFTDQPAFPTIAAVAAANSFDAALIDLSSTEFGDAANRRYMLHAVVGVDDQSGRPGGLRLPSDPLNFLSDCNTASSAGGGHQAASQLTQGLRFPICQFQTQPALFWSALMDHPRLFSDQFEDR
ncbi:MAG: hypothetical protein AAGA23_21185, partial [Pseudomonadota bacterium]